MYKSIPAEQAIRLAFLGCGAITNDHTKYTRYAEKNIALSYASRNIDKAKTYQKKHGGVHAFGSYAEAISSDDIDIIMINTPPDSHHELAKAALDNGKHVIVEKPPFFSSSSFDELGPIAEKNNLQFVIAENYYYKPLRTKLKSLLEQEIIGDILFININATKKQEASGDWRDDKAITGFGSLFEGGIHWINFINNIGLNITDVKGFIPKQMTELERSSQVAANTEEGAVINLFYSWEADTIFKGLRLSKIFGREGSITFETNGIFIISRGKKKKITFPGLSHIAGYKLMFKDFFQAIRSGQRPAFNWEMAKKDLVLIEQVYKSVSKI